MLMQSRHKEVLNGLKSSLGGGLLSAEVRETTVGVKCPGVLVSLWLSLQRDQLVRAVRLLSSFSPLHVSTPMASKEYADQIELFYFFSLFGGSGKWQELPVIVALKVPKGDLKVPTLTDLVPGILFMEQETIEMLGVEIVGIPDASRLWTAETIAAGLKPMRGVVHTVESEEGGSTA